MTTPALTSYLDRLPADGTFSLVAGPIDGPPVVTHQADVQHYAASTMKVALVLAAYRRADAGTLDLDRQITVHADFDSEVAGARFEMDRSEDSDDQTWAQLGDQVALRWLANRAIVRSGNLATNLLIEAVGLPAIAEALRAVGAEHSVVARKLEDLPARDAGVQNLVTAADLARTMRELFAGRVASPEAAREILDTLAAQQINDAIPVGLPAGTKVAHKSGWVTDISHDVALVFPPDTAPYVLAVCTTSPLTEAESLRLIADAAAASWQDRHLLTGARAQPPSRPATTSAGEQA